MAYNLEPLVQILDQILQPTDNTKLWILDPNRKPQLESFLEKACSLKGLFDSCSSSSLHDNNQMDVLESQIRVAAHEAEDVLESHIADRIRSTREGEGFVISPPDLHKIMEEFDFVKQGLIQLQESQPLAAAAAVSSSPAPTPSPSPGDPNLKNSVVGFDDDLKWFDNQLKSQTVELQIIPIVGMGGMGKTTLARTVYDDSPLTSEFDRCAWVTISQDYDKRNTESFRRILMDLLRGVIKGELPDEIREEEDVIKLQVHLYQILNSRRYLIVLDDMWRTSDWDDLRHCFPTNNEGSRIIVTTRESTVANYVSPMKRLQHHMKCLNEGNSWKLLCQIVFPKEAACPIELDALVEKYPVAKRITENCGGLPLAIQVIGGLLSQTNQESWERFATDVASAAASSDKDGRFSKILSLSYNHLPHHLRPYFLYMSAFPEDYEIRASKLIRLWEAEGFLKPVADKSLEETAHDHLKALVDRNLIFPRRQKIVGDVKSYGLHDLMRDLCVKRAREENYLHVKNEQVYDLPEGTSCLRRVSAHTSFPIKDILGLKELMPISRSFLCIGDLAKEVLSPVIFESRLLRVLDLLEMRFHQFPEEVLHIVNLRYLALTCRADLFPPSISRLVNLQTIICNNVLGVRHLISNYFIIVPEIWKLPRLRHLMLKTVYMSPPLRDIASCSAGETLQTLYCISDEVELAAIFPNLKKLTICAVREKEDGLSPDLNLNTLKKVKYIGRRKGCHFAVTFPPCLRRLTLLHGTIPPGYLNEIGKLTNLQALKLRICNFESPSWEPADGEFSQLKFLLLANLNLVSWEADETHFPKLQHLIVRGCNELEGIPSGIGNIPTLQMLEVLDCSQSAVNSAKKIKEQQLENCNSVLQVITRFSSE